MLKMRHLMLHFSGIASFEWIQRILFCANDVSDENFIFQHKGLQQSCVEMCNLLCLFSRNNPKRFIF